MGKKKKSIDSLEKQGPKKPRGPGDKNLCLRGVEYRWKPGQSGNPAGPPVAKHRAWSHFKRFLNMTAKELNALDKNTLTVSELGALSLAKRFMSGDPWPVKEAIDREEGPIPKIIEGNIRDEVKFVTPPLAGPVVTEEASEADNNAEAGLQPNDDDKA
jgi:hypothetical protein